MENHAEPRWQRNQIEAALWRYVTTAKNWGSDWDGLASSIPPIFRSRIKKLLNRDRGLDLPQRIEDSDKWAFYDSPGEGVGSETRFSTHHAFLMGIGLDLINSGLKQSDVVFFLKHTRLTLQDAFRQIHERVGARAPVTGSGRQRYKFVDDGSSEPIRLDPDGAAFADWSTWMFVQRQEAKEAFPLFNEQTQGRDVPFFFEPKFYFGLEEVKRQMFNNLSQFRHVLLVEISDLALTIPVLLSVVPAVRRGRPHGTTKAPQSDTKAMAAKENAGRTKKGGQ